MRYQSLAIIASTLAFVSALPSQIKKRDWTSDPDGNIMITFSDTTVNLGTLPISEIMNNMASVCATSGLCDTTAIDITGYQYITGPGGSVYDETVTITPEGDYPTWIHNGLLDALGAAVNAAAKCTTFTYTSTCGDTPYFCGATPVTITECVVPQFWGINWQPEGQSGAPPYMGVTMDVDVDSGSFCSTFTTIGSAVAGAVNGAAGSVFTLIGLTCQS